VGNPIDSVFATLEDSLFLTVEQHFAGQKTTLQQNTMDKAKSTYCLLSKGVTRVELPPQ